MAAGLPTEGSGDKSVRAGDVARRDVPTCRMDEPIDVVRKGVEAEGWDACVVVNDEKVVLGMLRDEEFQKANGERVEDAMLAGPSTFRPHLPIEEVAHFLAERDVVSSPVTTSDGRLVGLLRTEDAVHAAHQHHEHGAHGG